MGQIEELVQAIKTLESQRGTLGDPVVDTALEPLEEKLSQLEQNLDAAKQRRLVSVLFLDIFNSTSLSQGLEPEEVLDIIGGTLKRLSGPINAHGGSVTQVMGDGFMAVFGLIKTHEDDAREATRAGLEIITESKACAKELAQRYRIQGFNVRVGINTGRVVAGRFTEVESTVMGLTVSLAARMEQSAQPGTLTISQFTYQHIRGAFDVEVLGPVEVKGFPHPVTVYRVISARPRTFRIYTRGVEGVETDLIGRAGEFKQLKATMIHSFQERETQIITITGEAGMGKSRLLYEFDRWVAQSNERIVAFKARASHQMTSMPFGLLREMISYRLNLQPSDSADHTRMSLEEELSKYTHDMSRMKAHFIGSLLGFNFYDSPFLQGVINDPQQLAERAQQYLMQYITSVASHNNAIIMLDDIHWADQESLNFITRFSRDYPRLPLVIVCLARPIFDERNPEWMKDEGHRDERKRNEIESLKFSNINIGPLSHQESFELINQILRNEDILPEHVQEKLIIAAGGNPFYIEEYIQTLIDEGAIVKNNIGGSWTIYPEKLAKINLPVTLIALIESRLDNLTKNQRALLQQAAVIGQIFWLSTLQALRMAKPIEEKDLVSLSEHGYIYPQESPAFEGIKEYRFHHALLRDVAYQAMIKGEKKVYHGRAADWFINETRTRGREGEYATVIAEHCEFAGDYDRAADWYTTAGTFARRQGAPAQAADFFDHALSLLPYEDSSKQRPEDMLRRWKALSGRDEVLGILGETEKRKTDDDALVRLAQHMGDENYIAEAFYRQGFTLAESGQYKPAYESYNRGLAAARKTQNIRLEALILGVKVTCEVRMGDLKSASQTSVEALECAENLGDEQIMARTLNNASTFYTETGDLGRAIQLLDRQLEINRHTGNIEGEVVGLSNLGYTYVLIGLPGEGIPYLQNCIEKARLIGHRSFSAYGGLNLALAFIRNNDPSAALMEIDTHIRELESMNDVFGYAVGQNYTALALEMNGDVSGALALYERSAKVFTEIGVEGSAKDAEAGITRCLLIRNQLEEAEKYARSLLNYLKDKNGAGMEFPFMGYETCIDAFTQCGHPALARKILYDGYTELMKRAENISSKRWRKSFLELVLENHKIIERWLKISSQEGKESAE